MASAAPWLNLLLLASSLCAPSSSLALGGPLAASSTRSARGRAWREITPLLAPGFVNDANDKPLVGARRGLEVLIWRDSEHAASGGYGDLWSWTRSGRSGPWRHRTKLSGRASEHALFRLAVGPSGAMVICWLDKDGPNEERIRLRSMAPSSKRWSRPVTVATLNMAHPLVEGVHDLRVSVARSTARVAWLLGGGRLEERAMQFPHRLGPVEAISTEAEDVEFHLASTPAGEAIAALGTWKAQYAVASSPAPQTPFAPPSPLSSLPEVEGSTFFIPSYGNEIAVNRLGAAVAVWSTYVAVNEDPGRNVLYVDARPPGSAVWSAPIELSSNPDPNFQFEAQVQADSSGRFYVLAATDPAPASRQLTVFTSDPSGSTWRAKSLVRSLGPKDAFRLAAGAKGRAAVLYERAAGRQGASRLFGRAMKGRAGRWGRPALLDRATYPSDAGSGDTANGGNSGPAIAITPAGGALAAWVHGSEIRSALAPATHRRRRARRGGKGG